MTGPVDQQPPGRSVVARVALDGLPGLTTDRKGATLPGPHSRFYWAPERGPVRGATNDTRETPSVGFGLSWSRLTAATRGGIKSTNRTVWRGHPVLGTQGRFQNSAVSGHPKPASERRLKTLQWGGGFASRTLGVVPPGGHTESAPFACANEWFDLDREEEWLSKRPTTRRLHPSAPVWPSVTSI
jgi:hypothetical protein